MCLNIILTKQHPKILVSLTKLCKYWSHQLKKAPKKSVLELPLTSGHTVEPFYDKLPSGTILLKTK